MEDKIIPIRACHNIFRVKLPELGYISWNMYVFDEKYMYMQYTIFIINIKKKYSLLKSNMCDMTFKYKTEIFI